MTRPHASAFVSADPLHAIFGKLLGSEIKIQLDAMGKVTQLEGLSAMREKIERSTYQGPARHHIERLLNDTWLTFVLDQHYGSHAFSKVAIGQTWHRNYQFGNRPFKMIYTLDHVEKAGSRRVAIVTYKYDAKAHGQPKHDKDADHRHEAPDIRGILTFDAKTGRLFDVDESSLETIVQEKRDEKSGKTQRTETIISTRQTTSIKPHKPAVKNRPAPKSNAPAS